MNIRYYLLEQNIPNTEWKVLTDTFSERTDAFIALEEFKQKDSKQNLQIVAALDNKQAIAKAKMGNFETTDTKDLSMNENINKQFKNAWKEQQLLNESRKPKVVKAPKLPPKEGEDRSGNKHMPKPTQIHDSKKDQKIEKIHKKEMKEIDEEVNTISPKMKALQNQKARLQKELANLEVEIAKQGQLEQAQNAKNQLKGQLEEVKANIDAIKSGKGVIKEENPVLPDASVKSAAQSTQPINPPAQPKPIVEKK